MSKQNDAPKPAATRALKQSKPADGLFGVVGLICEVIFIAGIAIKPGSFEAVMYGGILGVAGLVLAIVAIASGRGRTPGFIALALFLGAWGLNTAITGRF